MQDLISRQWLMECVNEGWIKFDTEKDENRFIHLVRDMAPSVESEVDEWCTECKEYDKENHCCHRFTRVIRETIAECKEEMRQQWIPCSERLPEDYTDVLVWFEYFRYGDYNCFYQTHGIGSYSAEYDSWMINHETGWHKLRVLAWMPLPEPYKGEER